MPDLSTHFLLGEQILPKLSKPLQTLISDNRSVFNYGLQGPDILFFRKIFSCVFTGFSNLPLTGVRMHQDKVYQTLEFMKSYLAQKQDNQAEFEILSAYFLGFVGHYYLDKNIHPYVYFLIESIQKHHPERTARSIHGKIESEISAILYEYFYKQPVTTFRVNQHFQISILAKNIIARMYTCLLSSIYGIQTEVGEIMKCFDEMRKACRLLYDNTGFLEHVRDVLGEIFPKTLDLTNQIKPKKVMVDTANLNQNLWHHIQHPTQTSRKSILGLFLDTQEELIPVLNELYTQLTDESPFDFEICIDFDGNDIAPIESEVC